MVRKRRLPPGLAGDVVRIGGFLAQRSHDLGAAALDRIGIEARLVEREPQKLDARLHAVPQHPDRAGDVVQAHRKAQLDGVGLDPLLEGGGIEFAGAVVEQGCGHVADAGLVGRVLAAAAREREIHRDQRQRAFMHQPGLDAAGRDHALDLGGVRGMSRRQQRCCHQNAEPVPGHERLSSRARVLTR
jgi:hypothetical protein